MDAGCGASDGVVADVGLGARIESFGFRDVKPAVLEEGTVLFDCRILRNPHFVDRLRELNGLDPEVQHYVQHDPRFPDLFRAALTQVKPGRTVQFACYGGRHRSVAMAELIAHAARAVGICVTVEHQSL